MDRAFRSLEFENAAGERILLSSPSISSYWELRGRTGFTAPEVQFVTEKYVNGNTRIVNRIVQPRTVRINMIVTGETTAKRDTLFRQMVDILMNTSGGEIGKLYVTRSDGRTLILNCAYSSGLSITEEYDRFHRFTLEFYAADPYFYTMPIIQILEFLGDIITLRDDLYLGNWCLGWSRSYGNLAAENNTGAEAEPIYEISGTRENLIITNTTLGKSITLNDLDMVNGDTLIIDTRQRYKSVYIRHDDGSVVSALGSLSWSAVSLSLPLPEGESLISADTLGTVDPLKVSIQTAMLSA